jgi:hypothetical protein
MPGRPSRAPKSSSTDWKQRTSRSGCTIGWRMASAGPSALEIGRSSSEIASQRSRYVVSGSTRSLYATISDANASE